MKNKKKKTKVNTGTRKISIIFIILLFLMGMSVFLYASEPEITDPIDIIFKDKNLYDRIKNCFGKNIVYIATETDAGYNIKVSKSDIQNISELNLSAGNAYEAQITDITGLEAFTSLKTLNLSSNNITDLTPLGPDESGNEKLSQLATIDLSNNININIYNNGICYLPNSGMLENVNVANTNADINFIEKLPNLKILNIANNGISSLEILSSIDTQLQLECLDISGNDIKKIDDILYLSSTLKKLNMRDTGISTLYHSLDDDYEIGIFLLRELEELDVSNNKLLSDIYPITETYYNEINNEYFPYLSKLKVLNISNTSLNNIDELQVLTNLTHIYAIENEIYYIGDGLTRLDNLQVLDLSDNYIDDISGFIQYEGETIVNTLSAKEIYLANNIIQDITPLAELRSDVKKSITHLDLSGNRIYFNINIIDFGNFPALKELRLQEQGKPKKDVEEKVLAVKKKASWDILSDEDKANQYIFLPELFQNSKNNESLLYAENIEFEIENTTLNSDTRYNKPGYYNVIIEPPHEDEYIEEREIRITLYGGCANGSTLRFQVQEDDDAIDSILFADKNLAIAIGNSLDEQAAKNEWDENPSYYTYTKEDILNVTYFVIGSTTELSLNEKNISNLQGLDSFENLTKLELAKNNITSISKLGACIYMQELDISNNNNIRNNNNAIENMTRLVKLNLSGTGMTNITSLQNLIKKWEENNYFELTNLNISNNNIGDISDIGKINTLTNLNISNIGVADLLELETLTNLETLYASGNGIQDVTPLRQLAELDYLYINNNKVENITPISRMSLQRLEFANNRVEDISSLSGSYRNGLIMDYNQINRIPTDIENKTISEFSVRGQKISYAIPSDKTGEIIVELPEIFKSTKIENSKVATTKMFEINQDGDTCSLTSDGNSVVVNTNNLINGTVTVTIKGGTADGTEFAIATPLIPTITYNPSNDISIPTKGPVTATISFNRPVNIINNNGQNTFIFENNGSFEFEYVDEYGFEGNATAVVENIDKEAPQGTVSQTVEDGKVIVTIQVSEEIAEISGWEKTINKDGKIILTKIYEVDSVETVKLIDLAGNETNIKVEVTIDKTAPKITGVTDGETYSTSVTPQVEDQSEVTIKLTKDGSVISNYKIGTPITDIGLYELTVTDIFGNTTTVSFEIEVSDIITSDEVTVAEQELVIKNIDPKTTVSGLKSLLEAQMDYTIIDKNGNLVSENAKVGTGYQIKMPTNKIYTLIVKGDCNGDGDATITDIFSINSHRLKVKSLSGIYLQAVDVNNDAKADIKDIFKINSYRLQGGEL